MKPLLHRPSKILISHFFNILLNFLGKVFDQTEARFEKGHSVRFVGCDRFCQFEGLQHVNWLVIYGEKVWMVGCRLHQLHGIYFRHLWHQVQY